MVDLQTARRIARNYEGLRATTENYRVYIGSEGFPEVEDSWRIDVTAMLSRTVRDEIERRVR